MSKFMEEHQTRINSVLTKYMPNEQAIPIDLSKAMRYTTLNVGKRIRPLLVYATGEAFNADEAALDNAAAAVELIHSYTLIHDDLPAMDDDDLRHGKPSCHKTFNDAIAILTGDALQSLAFELLANNLQHITPKQCLRMVNELAKAIGYAGVVGGQILDLEAENKKINLEQLKQIHQLKTAKLITASILLGALASNQTTESQLKQLNVFGEKIGLAFQIRDDILDIEASTEALGKQQGADLVKHKATYPALMGLDNAHQYLDTVYQEALTALRNVGTNFEILEGLAEFIIHREH